VGQYKGLSKAVRVLLIEGDPRAATAVCEMLRAIQGHGLVITQTDKIADAAQELVDHGATCVLLDAAPGTNVVEAVQQLSAAAPDTPIIVLADRASGESGVAAVRAGAQDHLFTADLNATVLGRAVRYAIERKRSEVALALQALHDPLTALPNRALFLDRLRVALDRSRRTGGPVVVMFLDVDGFKAVNDSLGHTAGDLLLTVLADRFRGLLRPMDTVARFGGDEFTFLFEGLDGDRDAALVAQRISRSAGLPLALGDDTMSISVSIGVTIVGDPQGAIEEVIRQADVAMYRAKELGGARFEMFDGVMRRLPRPRSELERALRQAMARSELRVHYQPRVSLDAETGLQGFEALVRWDHPERGLMEPVDFMSVAEETGLIVPIGEWVLDQALQQVRRWRQTRPGVTITVNLSGRQLRDPGLVGRLSTAMRDGGHDPAAVCLEVSAAAVEAEPELATRQLAALNEMGFTLAIDDFGIGAASSTTLSRLPVHVLVIDQTLVSGLDRGDRSAGSVTAAVELGHRLGMSVVAEGVETDAQLAALRDLGCDGAQGYLFSEPVPEESVISLLRGR
jgi:diguanylate cyclase (GGDEF)-like protein